MDPRTALYDSTEPASLSLWLPRGVAVLAAALGGLGVVFWVAANWEQFGRFGRFALLQGLVVAMGLGAAALSRARAPLGLVALLGIGGLFAYFGQTYQTGADPWQLFALWAALSLPLVLATRSDVLWAPWVLVAMSAITLWVHAHAGHGWRMHSDTLAVHLAGWGMAWGLAASIAAPLRRFTGAGIWSLRAAFSLATLLVTTTALAGLLFEAHVAPHYGVGVAVLALAAAGLASRRFFDIYGLSAVALGLDALLVAGVARWLFHDLHGSAIGPLLIVGLLAATLLAATVDGVMRLSRRRASGERA